MYFVYQKVILPFYESIYEIMSEIRVTYSGLVAFIIGILGIITGLVFTIIITRSLTLNEFGSWNIIGSLVGYPLVLGPIVWYWTTREVARGTQSGKTSTITISFFSLIGIAIYLLIIYFFNQAADIEYFILLFALILIPSELFKQLFLSIGLAYKPHKVEIGVLIFELSKITLALTFLYVFQMGLVGVILAVSFSNVAAMIFVFFIIKEKIKGKFRIGYVKKWIKLWWIPTYPSLIGLINNLDVIIFTVLTGSVGGVAYWAATRAIAHIVHNSVKINKAVYPKLLAGGGKEFLQDNIVRITYFAFPLTAMSLAFAKPALFALNPVFLVAVPIIGILVFSSFSRTFSDIFEKALSGNEKVDIRKNANFKDYFRSKLVVVPFLRMIQRLSYISILAFVLFFVSPWSPSEVEMVTYWAIIALATHIPYTLCLYKMVRKEFSLKMKWRPMLKYLAASVLVFGIAFWSSEQYLKYEESIFVFLPYLLMFVIPTILGYLGLTYIVDKETRKLCNTVIKELKKGKK